MGIVMVLIVAALVSPTLDVESSINETKRIYTVVIDAGHGGIDCGKVGLNDALEKDINLQMALQLKGYLEASDVNVILTRDGDYGHYSETDSNKKKADMAARNAIVAESHADVLISIHQNSYHLESVTGPQVFYYTSSSEGKVLAQIIQKQFTGVVGEDNNRIAKANNSYYLLRNINCTSVIVECGFLSNYEEAVKLSNTEYQKQMTWAIHNGIMIYLNTLD